jgi:hypothetical protein
MATVGVGCAGTPEDGWVCDVTVRDGVAEVSRHRVRVRPADLVRLSPGAASPELLVEASFAFLLERESPGSILRSFDLMDIGHYFPEYEATIMGLAT